MGSPSNDSPGTQLAAVRPLADVRAWVRENASCSTVELIDALQHDQQARWEQGERVPAEAYLRMLDGAGPGVAADEQTIDLIYSEILLRRDRGESLFLSEYAGRFPDRAEQLRLLLDLDHRLSGDAPIRDDEPAATQPEAGRSVGRLPRVGRYAVEEVVGRGGMGVVYKAHDPVLDRTVALKLVPVADEEGWARFRVEAEAVGRLQHPNIVQIYEIGEADDGRDGCQYMALEFVGGGTLAGHLRGGPLPPRQAAGLVETLARAVHYAHQHGILHRDLKPGNVLLSAECGVRSAEWKTGDMDFHSALRTPHSALQPKVSDFGLAKRLDRNDDRTQTGAVLGTPNYMAPEQAAGGAVGTPADVYALGAILYECLTGRPPFAGPTALDTLEQVRSRAPAPPGRVAPGIPRDLETVCLTCLRKEPGKRYASAAALADDLARFLAGRPVLARRVGPLGRAAMWCRRNPGVASTLAAAVAVVLVVTGVAFSRVLNERDRYRAEREQAVANLYRSRVGEARALRLGRTNGYRMQAWDRLRQAAELDTPARDLDELREEAVASLGDFVGQEPAVWEKPGPGRYLVALAIDAQNGEAIFGVGGERNEEGRLLVRRLSDGGVVANWTAHPRGIFAVAVGPGGRLVSADEAGGVKVWKRSGPAAWECIRQLALPSSDRPNHVNAVTLSLTPDGRELVGCSRGAAELRRWNLDAGGEPTPISDPGGGRFLTAAFSPDGRWLAAGVVGAGPDRVLIWEARTGRPLPPVAPGLGAVEGLTFSGDGRYLACACEEGVAVFTAPEFRPRFVVRGEMLYTAAFSPSGRWLAIPAPELGTTRVWDVAVNREVAVLKHPDEPHTAAFHPDGGSLVITSANSTQSWNLRGAGERTVLAGHQAAVTAISFTRDGTGLASAGADRTVRLWDPGTGRQRRVLDGFGGAVLGVAFAPDGRHVAIVEEGRGVRLWDVGAVPARELTALATAGGSLPGGLAWAPDGRHLAVAGVSGVMLWPRAGADPVAFGPPGALTAINSDRVAFSPDGLHLSWVQNNSIVCIRNLDSGTTHRRLAKNLDGGRLGGTAFFPDSRLLVMGEHGEAEVWDAAGGGRVDPLGVILSAERVNWYQGQHVAVDPAAVLVAVQYRDTHVWDVGRRRLLFRLPREHAAATCLACSPTAGQLVIGSADGGLVAWDLDRVRAELDRIGLGW